MSNLEKVKKGDQVVMLGFTGMRIGEFTVTGATKTELSVESKTGNTLKFSRKTGKQIGLEEDRERYANKIVLPEDAPEPTPKKKAKKEELKKAKEEPKKSKPEPEDDDDDEEEDDLDGILAGMTLTELFEYADENEVDLSQLNKKQKKDKGTVIDAIKEALEDDEYEEFDED
jgi:hypothetical protein